MSNELPPEKTEKNIPKPREDELKARETNRTAIKSLRTYQGDVEEAIGKNKFSASTIFVAEQKRKELFPDDETRALRSKKRNKFFVTIGTTLLLLGVLGVSGVYYFKLQEKVEIEQKSKALIGFSEEKIILVENFKRENLISRIVEERGVTEFPLNSVLFLNTSVSEDRREKTEKILSLLAPSMPPSLIRSFGDEYMIGIYAYDTNTPFIILTTKDYASSYSGMLKWEKNMPQDLSQIFSISNQNSSGTTPFVDEEIKNKDLRVLRDLNKVTLMAYSFIDKNTLVIAINENIVSAILAKYLISKQTK